MPNTSKRAREVPLSPFRKLAPVADRAKASGKRIYHLNIGQPDIETPPSAVRHLQTADLKILAYSPATGLLSYREKLVGYYRKYGIEVSPEEIIVTTGASEAIQLLFNACLNPGEEIIIPEPFYANYNGFAAISGLRIKPITCHIEQAFALPQVEDFEKLVTAQTRAIFITNPSNPTGRFYSRRVLEGLGELAKKYDLYLFVDEVYREFCYDGDVFFSALNLEGLEENVVMIDSVSKRYSACGARVGSIVTRNGELIEVITRYVKLRLSPPVLGQILAEGLLDVEDTYLEDVKLEYDRRRMIIFNRLQKMRGVESYRPGGAFYCFVRLPIANAEHFCRWLLEDFEYNGASVMLSPGEGFYATPGKGVDEVRIAYILNATDLEASMDILEKALDVYSVIHPPERAKSHLADQPVGHR